MRVIRAAVLAFLLFLTWGGTVFAQDGGSPLTVNGSTTVPITVEVTLPPGSAVPTITISLDLDVQSLVTLDTSEAATGTIELRAVPKQKSASGGAVVAAVKIGKIQPGAAEVHSTASADSSRRISFATPTPVPAAMDADDGSLGAATAIPTAVTESQGQVAAVSAAANLRSGPGTGYEIVARAEPGELVTVTGQTASGEWLQLSGGAWIAAFLLEEVPDGPAVVAEIPPLPTPQPVEERAGWRSYRLISGDAAFSYPPDWEITDEDSKSATLEPVGGGAASIVVTGSKAVIDFTDTTGAIRSLKSEMADVSGFDMRFLAEGTLPQPGSPVYVVASAEYEGSTVGFLAVMAPVGSRTVTLLYVRINRADVSAEALPLLTDMAATLTP
ncbi:MAG: SH3 domain-containing protein [Caldilineaceae bacterium]